MNSIDKIKRRLFQSFIRNETSIHQLRYLFWECTLRCNLNCRHCGSDCLKDSDTKDMPAEDFIAQAKKISDSMNSQEIMVVITGGEPLLRKDLSMVGKALREMGFRWSIVTNGLAYNEKKHAELMAAGMGAITLSFDGLEQEHNWLRNSSFSFTKAEKALDILIHTPRLNFDVVTCVNPLNVNYLDEIYSYLLQKELKAWRLFTIAPIGRAVNNDQLLLSAEQFTKMITFIKQKKIEKRMSVNFSCEGYVGEYENIVRDGYFFCRAGIHIGSILNDGSVSACPNIDRGFVQGNIYKKDFTEIWENCFQIMRDRSWTEIGQCKSCKDYRYCRGNGFHLWKADPKSLLQCHKHNILLD